MEHKEKITAKEGRVAHLPEKAPVDASGKEVLLSLKNVDITFGKGDNAVRAVKNASFDIYKGETFSLVGESGSGKTTIGRAVIRVNPAPPVKFITRAFASPARFPIHWTAKLSATSRWFSRIPLHLRTSAQPLTTLSPKASITSTSLKMRRIA